MRTNTRKKPLMSTGILIAAVASLLALSAGPAQGDDDKNKSKKNTKLVGFDDLQARSAYQPIIQQQGDRWIAYVGHHSGSALNPLTGDVEQNGVSIVDVTDPEEPDYLFHLPATGMRIRDRINSGSQMVQTCLGDDLPGPGTNGNVYLLRANGAISHEVWDVTDPSAPVFVSTAVAEPGADATHKNWWDCESGIAYIVYDGRQRGWRTNRLLWVVDLGDPTTPVFIRNFGLVGQEPGSTVEPVPAGMHEATLSPNGDRLYPAYGTGNNGVLQIVDVEALLTGPSAPIPENLLSPQIGRVDMPTFWGGHTAWPIIGIDVPEQAGFIDSSPRDFVVLVSESLRNECQENSHDMVFMVDITDETKPFPVANYQVPESEGDFCNVGGRFGAHSMNWSFNPNFYKKLIVISYFNAGARVVDIRDPFHPKEVAFFIPDTTDNTAPRGDKIAIQTNNVEIDDRNFIYLADRANTGLHIVELKGKAKKIIDGDDD